MSCRWFYDITPLAGRNHSSGQPRPSNHSGGPTLGPNGLPIAAVEPIVGPRGNPVGFRVFEVLAPLPSYTSTGSPVHRSSHSSGHTHPVHSSHHSSQSRPPCALLGCFNRATPGYPGCCPDHSRAYYARCRSAGLRH